MKLPSAFDCTSASGRTSPLIAPFSISKIRSESRRIKSILCSTTRIASPLVPVQPDQDFENFLDDRGLNAFRRLIQQQQLWTAAQATGERQDLLLAARKRGARTVDQRIKPRESRQNVVDDVLFRIDPVFDEAHARDCRALLGSGKSHGPAARNRCRRARAETTAR